MPRTCDTMEAMSWHVKTAHAIQQTAGDDLQGECAVVLRRQPGPRERARVGERVDSDQHDGYADHESDEREGGQRGLAAWSWRLFIARYLRGCGRVVRSRCR